MSQEVRRRFCCMAYCERTAMVGSEYCERHYKECQYHREEYEMSKRDAVPLCSVSGCNQPMRGALNTRAYCKKHLEEEYDRIGEEVKTRKEAEANDPPYHQRQHSIYVTQKLAFTEQLWGLIRKYGVAGNGTSTYHYEHVTFIAQEDGNVKVVENVLGRRDQTLEQSIGH